MKTRLFTSKCGLAIALSLALAPVTNATTYRNNYQEGILSKNLISARQTCEALTLIWLNENFPIGSIVNDGYANYEVLGYSETFGALSVTQVDIYNNRMSSATSWLCARDAGLGQI